MSLKQLRLSERQDGEVVSGYCRISRIGNQPTFWFLQGRTGDCAQDVTLISPKELTYGGQPFKPSLFSTLQFEGVVQSSPDGRHREVKLTKVLFYGYFPQDQLEVVAGMKPELLREKESQRLLTKYYQQMLQVYQAAERALLETSDELGLLKVRAPFITFSDCEGGGEVFRVVSDIPGFFSKPAYLTVSGQVDEETITARLLCPTYIYGPSFRSDPSQTSFHACEFWHYEPEVPFITLEGLMKLEEDTIKGVIRKLLAQPAVASAIRSMRSRTDDLEKMASEPFASVSYTEAIKILRSCGEVFDVAPEWGIDPTKQHERYLCERHFQRPTFVWGYPSKIKSFYMLQAEPFVDPEIGPEPLQTCCGVDLLVPGVGELCGGSLREHREDTLLQQMKDRGLDPQDYREYLDLRVQGTFPHGGYGLGFDRFLMFLTGAKSIRDIAPFPRYYQKAATEAPPAAPSAQPGEVATEASPAAPSAQPGEVAPSAGSQ